MGAAAEDCACRNILVLSICGSWEFTRLADESLTSKQLNMLGRASFVLCTCSCGVVGKYVGQGDGGNRAREKGEVGLTYTSRQENHLQSPKAEPWHPCSQLEIPCGIAIPVFQRMLPLCCAFLCLYIFHPASLSQRYEKYQAAYLCRAILSLPACSVP